MKRIRFSRPCYDKPHRCPGWAGGGMGFATVSRCTGGSLSHTMYEKSAWQWRFNRCESCGVIVWPFVVRTLDWRWWKWKARGFFRYSVPFTYRNLRRRWSRFRDR